MKSRCKKLKRKEREKSRRGLRLSAKGKRRSKDRGSLKLRGRDKRRPRGRLRDKGSLRLKGKGLKTKSDLLSSRELRKRIKD